MNPYACPRDDCDWENRAIDPAAKAMHLTLHASQHRREDVAAIRATGPGCPVRDGDLHSCPERLWLDEHRLVEGKWLHPDEIPTDFQTNPSQNGTTA